MRTIRELKDFKMKLRKRATPEFRKGMFGKKYLEIDQTEEIKKVYRAKGLEFQRAF